MIPLPYEGPFCNANELWGWSSLHNQEAYSTPGSAGQACRTCQVCVWGEGGGKRRTKGRKREKKVCHFCFTLFIYLKNFRNAKFTKIHRSRIAWIFPIVIEIPCEGLCEGGLLVPSFLPMPSLSLRSFKAPLGRLQSGAPTPTRAAGHLSLILLPPSGQPKNMLLDEKYLLVDFGIV